MKLPYIFSCCIIALLLSYSVFAQEHPTLPIGSLAPDFSLPGIDGKTYTLASFKDAKLLVIIFMCNHCPTSQAYEQRIIDLVNDYRQKGVAIVGINPNNPASLRLDELGYSDVGDSFEDMKTRARDKHFNFPYLYDGETEATAKKYGPVSTPHVFIFDSKRILRFCGRIDDNENPRKPHHSQDSREAIEALLAGKDVAVTTTKVFGCSIKWIEKKDWIEKAAITWAKEKVDIQPIDTAGVRDLMNNPSDKLKLINIWSVKSKQCRELYPALVELLHLYRDRGLELVTINVDGMQSKDSLLAFLHRQEASGNNYVFSAGDMQMLETATGKKWNGKMPFTILIEPRGSVSLIKQGMFDLEETRKQIFNDKFMGRIFP